MEIGTAVWVRDSSGDEWLEGVVSAKTPETDSLLKNEASGEQQVYIQLTVSTKDPTAPDRTVRVPLSRAETDEIKLRDEDKDRSTIDDLITLRLLHEPEILSALSARFDHDKIYTFTGPILLAVNPFKSLSLYQDRILEMYYNHGLLKSQKLLTEAIKPLPPHVFAVADMAFRQMMEGLSQRTGSGVDSHSGVPGDAAGAVGSSGQRVNQSILVSGESGAGKTETTKFVMKYLAIVGSPTGIVTLDGESVTGRILDSNNILEAFGNAATIRNHNSSRFGKFIELNFDKNGYLVGASIKTYLLEKVRLVYHAPRERNFHAFYQLCAGAPSELLEEFSLKPSTEYLYLNQGHNTQLSGLDDKAEFTKTWAAMRRMGFTEQQSKESFQLVAALMSLGNITFVQADKSTADGGATISEESKAMVDIVAKLLQVKSTDIEKALCVKEIKTRNEVIITYLSPAKAAVSRDSLAKSMYGRLFDWIVSMINKSIDCAVDSVRSFIAVLDIFGFEKFELNSFEQLCINYTNEKLQQLFNQHIFKVEQSLYDQEGIQWSFVNFPDNQECLDLIDQKPGGLLALLDDECKLPKGSDESWARKIYKDLAQRKRLTVSNAEKSSFRFTLVHYAGPVSYTCASFLEKNKDELPQESYHLMANGSSFLQQLLFSTASDSTASQTNVLGKTDSGRGKLGSSSSLVPSVSSQFKEQLNRLMQRIQATSPHYIRCLKPNDLNKPELFVKSRIVDQLRYGGVLQAVKVTQAGYPVRISHTEFSTRFRLLLLSCKSSEVSPAVLSPLDDSVRILNAVAKVSPTEFADSQYQVGKTLVFLRKRPYEVLEGRRVATLRTSSISIQRMWRGHRARSRYRRCQDFIFWTQGLVRGFLCRRKLRNEKWTASATQIQNWYRCRSITKKYMKTRRSIVRFSAVYRGRRCRKTYLQRRREIRASSIQAIARGFLARRSLSRSRKACITLQCWARRLQAYQRLQILREDARNNGKLKQRIEDLQQEIQLMKKKLEQEAAARREEEFKSAQNELEQLRTVLQQTRESSTEAEKAFKAEREELKMWKEKAQAALSVSQQLKVQLDIVRRELKEERDARASQRRQSLHQVLKASSLAASLATTTAIPSLALIANGSNSIAPPPPRPPPRLTGNPATKVATSTGSSSASVERSLTQGTVDESSQVTQFAKSLVARGSQFLQSSPSFSSLLANTDSTKSQKAAEIAAGKEKPVVVLKTVEESPKKREQLTLPRKLSETRSAEAVDPSPRNGTGPDKRQVFEEFEANLNQFREHLSAGISVIKFELNVSIAILPTLTSAATAAQNSEVAKMKKNSQSQLSEMREEERTGEATTQLQMKLKGTGGDAKLTWKFRRSSSATGANASSQSTSPASVLSRRRSSVRKFEQLFLHEIIEVSPSTESFSTEIANLKALEEASRENVDPTNPIEERFITIISCGNARILGLVLQSTSERDKVLNGLKSLVADLYLRQGRQASAAAAAALSPNMSPVLSPVASGASSVPATMPVAGAAEPSRLSTEMRKLSGFFKRSGTGETPSFLASLTTSPRNSMRKISLFSASNNSTSAASSITAVSMLEKELQLLKKRFADQEEGLNQLTCRLMDTTSELQSRNTLVQELQKAVEKFQREMVEQEQLAAHESTLKMQLGKRLERLLIEKEELREEKELLQQSFNGLLLRMSAIETPSLTCA